MKHHVTFFSLFLVAVLIIPGASAQGVLSATLVDGQPAPSDEAIVSVAARDGRSVVGAHVIDDPTRNAIADDNAVPISAPEAPASRRRWKVFSRNIERALASGHEGLQTSAMRHIIHYGDDVKISEEAVFDVMRMYRNHDNERVRRMAVVTLSQTNSRWAMRFLERAVRFEKSPALKHTIQAVLAEYNQSKSAS